MANRQCPLCHSVFRSLMKHVRSVHPSEYKMQCEMAIDLFKSGLTLREIGEDDRIYWTFGSALYNVIITAIGKDEMKMIRAKRISETMKKGYAANKYDQSNKGRPKKQV
jgi:hypothetical protein